MEWFMSMDVLLVLLAVGSIVIGAVTSLFIPILLIWLIVRYLRNGWVVKKWSERRQTRSKDRV
ncbi:hypothetical protein [Exiguobacterium sp. AT1b]|jgi:uncharacterized protein HemY|uniref:Uncharacterized protein n=1 Tax=Exiguobacterium sp. (strain ATCC BAA-1283 / AT1b) TaxID=360911 RepID=C4L6I3_EXISA|nr:hypothetical protein [Exiguobacterium sp. AT1b]ACQ70014.1 hypothetical protein EAT1b_1086 [Exiguobacterium sp. AT1b]